MNRQLKLLGENIGPLGLFDTEEAKAMARDLNISESKLPYGLLFWRTRIDLESLKKLHNLKTCPRFFVVFAIIKINLHFGRINLKIIKSNMEIK